MAKARIDSAFPLTDAQLAELTAALEKHFGKKIEATVNVDPALIGGARITVGDTVIDALGRGAAPGDGHPAASLISKPLCAGASRAGQREDTMQLNPSEISELIKSKIQNLDTGAEVRTQGTVVSVTDGICRVHGLSDAMAGEMLEFPQNTFGLALNLERDSVGAVILGDYEHITEGDTVKCTGPHPLGAGRPRADRPRRRFARAADRRQGPDQRQGDRTSSRRSRPA